jgi:hypothetical protein
VRKQEGGLTTWRRMMRILFTNPMLPTHVSHFFFAGLQNCGTTAFADTLFVNLKRDPTIHVEHPRAYNVPWRKHTPWRYRYNITSPNYNWQEDKDLVLPVVLVREPYRWMQSKLLLFVGWSARSYSTLVHMVSD